MFRRVVVWQWLLLISVSGCGKSTRGTPGGGTTPAASVTPGAAAGLARSLTTEPLSSPSAFELAAGPSGLRLFWALQAKGAGWLREAELAHDGAPRGTPQVVAVPPPTLGSVTDLSVTFLGEQRALAWIEKGQRESRAVATVVEGSAPSVLLDLGPAAVAADSARGNIAIAAETDRARALVMWRGLEAPCVEPQATACTGFTFRRLRAGAADTTGLPLSVPTACVAHSVELAISPGRFHYGVCTRDAAEPVTTMFSIQYDPEYARAEPLLKGCQPLGTLEAGGVPWLVGDCHGRRRAVPVPLVDEPVHAEDIDALGIRCAPEQAVLKQGRFTLTLREPRASLESVLPPSWLPSGSRAGWTGQTLVVAYVSGGQLLTRSYACRAGQLIPR